MQTSLDIAVYELNSRVITDAIVEAARRGRTVRVVTDDRSAADAKMTFRELRAAGIPVVADTNPSALMHNKFAIIDRAVVWTGSWNYTDGATYANNENAIALEDAEVAARYQQVFDHLFAGRFGKERPAAPVATTRLHGIAVLFAPENPILAELMSKVVGARRSIEFLTFSFTLDELAQQLRAAAARGVAVRGIFEKALAGTARGPAGSVVRTLCHPDSQATLRFDSNPRYLHHDAFVIDGQIMITGSLNFSRAALQRNDENVVMIPDAALAKRFENEFSRLWATGVAPDPAACADKPA